MSKSDLNGLDESGALMISAAAAFNAEVVHRDNLIDSAFEKLGVLEESVATIRDKLERERSRGSWAGSPESEAFRRFAVAVREADRKYQKAGETSTRTWLHEFLLPEMEEAGVALLCVGSSVKGRPRT